MRGALPLRGTVGRAGLYPAAECGRAGAAAAVGGGGRASSGAAAAPSTLLHPAGCGRAGGAVAVVAAAVAAGGGPASSGAGADAAQAALDLLPPELSDFRPNVGICVVNRAGKVFAARRVDDPNPESWQMPQGGIDDGETPREAALRELFEEASIRSVRVAGELPGWVAYEFPPEVRATFRGAWARFRGQAQRWFLVVFTGDDSEIDLETSHREFSEWRWADLGELPGKVIPFKREAYERVAAELGPQIERLRAAGELR